MVNESWRLYELRTVHNCEFSFVETRFAFGTPIPGEHVRLAAGRIHIREEQDYRNELENVCHDEFRANPNAYAPCWSGIKSLSHESMHIKPSPLPFSVRDALFCPRSHDDQFLARAIIPSDVHVLHAAPT